MIGFLLAQSIHLSTVADPGWTSVLDSDSFDTAIYDAACGPFDEPCIDSGTLGENMLVWHLPKSNWFCQGCPESGVAPDIEGTSYLYGSLTPHVPPFASELFTWVGLVHPSVLSQAQASGGLAHHELALPLVPELAGLSIFLQATAYDGIRWRTSNAVELVLH